MTDTKKNSRVVGGSPAESFFARSLRYWRKQRGLSQMDLALEAGVSTRHLSFLETDRSRPGRVVVERLLAGLELEELDRRALLAAAGFPPEPASSPPNDRGDSGRADEKTRILFQRMLDQQEPYPGLVLDALGNIQNFNSGARRLFRLLDRPEEIAKLVATGSANLLELYFAPDGFTRFVEDPEATGRLVFAQARQELLALDSPEAKRLLRHLLEIAPYLKEPPPPGSRSGDPVFETVMRKGDLVLRLQSAMAILGTSLTGSRAGLRLETIFPADDATRRFFEA